MKIEPTPENADLFDGFGNGSLHLYFVRNPENWHGEDRGDAFYTELDFHARDWDALFIDVLHFPGWDEYAEGDDIDELHERNRKKFELTIPAYPKLARLFDMYEDYQFKPEELPLLREECLVVQSTTSNAAALKALRKLIFACDEAARRGCHLLFICD